MVSPIPRLIDVARRPSVETGAGVPGYSGGLAACVVVSSSDLLSPWVADPGFRDWP
jgi:hypothetical protein